MNRAMHRICAPWVAGLGVLAFAAGPVFAQTQSLPVRKPGLWEVTIRGAGDSMMRQQKVQIESPAIALPASLRALKPVSPYIVVTLVVVMIRRPTSSG